MNNEYVYAVRNKETGKIVSNITNPRRKYWVTESRCQEAIMQRVWHRSNEVGMYEVVKFRLVEVTDEDN